MRGGGAICPKPPQAEKLVQSHEAIAQEVAPFGIKVQTINPGAYLTGYNETMADTAFRWLDAEKKLTKSAELLLLGLRLKIKYPQILDSAREGSIRQSLPSTALSVGRFACCRCQCLAEIIEIPGSFYVVVCDHHLGVFFLAFDAVLRAVRGIFGDERRMGCNSAVVMANSASASQSPLVEGVNRIIIWLFAYWASQLLYAHLFDSG